MAAMYIDHWEPALSGHLLFATQYHYLTIVLYIIYVSRAFTQRLSNVYVY
jgi:hypothetical protein